MDRLDYQQQLEDEYRQRLEDAREWREWSMKFEEETRRICKASHRAWDQWGKQQEKTWLF